MGRVIVKKERIVTERLTLRPYRAEDRERLAEMLRNPEITKTFMVPDYPEKAQYDALADRLIKMSGDTVHLEYGVYLDGYMIGFVNDCGYDGDTIELGYVIDPAFRGHGYAPEAVRAVIGEIREMGFKKVVAGYFEGNTASLRVMEKCGLRPNGHTEEEEYRGRTYLCRECEMVLG